MVYGVGPVFTTDGDISTRGELPDANSPLPFLREGFLMSVAMGYNSATPQQKLESLIKGYLKEIDNSLNNMEKPPVEYFRSTAVLKELSDRLRAVRSSIIASNKEYGGHSLFEQLVSLEIKAIDVCLSSRNANDAKEAVNVLSDNGSLSFYRKEQVLPSLCLKAA